MIVRMNQGEHEACKIVQGRKHAVILDGGFGGVYAAIEFEQTLARKSNLDVMLVNRDNFFLFRASKRKSVWCSTSCSV